MGRANWIILGIGLVACLAMSLAMQHLIGQTEEQQRPKLVKDLDRVYAAKLAGPSTMKTFEQAGHQVMEILVQALPEHRDGRFAADLGAMAWNSIPADQDFDAVLVSFLASGESGEGKSDRVGEDVDEIQVTYQVFERFILRPPTRIVDRAEIDWDPLSHMKKRARPRRKASRSATDSPAATTPR